MTTHPTPHRPIVPPLAGSVGRFMMHVGEMLLAMAVGVAAFGALLSAILLAAGTSFDDVLQTVPEFAALALMFNMTVPMVLWMRQRGHSAGRVREMAGAMVAVGVAACVLLWFSVIDSTAICGVECALMIPAMIAVMLLHAGEYSHPAHIA